VSKRVMLAAYGEADDRKRLLRLAERLDKSQSQVIMTLVRDKYREIFGDQMP
jgi:hypothetical protein